MALGSRYPAETRDGYCPGWSNTHRYLSVAMATASSPQSRTRPPPCRIMPFLDRPADESAVRSYPVPTIRALAPRFGGTSLFYLSSQGTGDGLWRVLDGQASEVWKGADAVLSEPAVVSPAGDRVAVVVRRQGKRVLMVMTAEGTNVRTSGAVDRHPGCGRSERGSLVPGRYVDRRWRSRRIRRGVVQNPCRWPGARSTRRRPGVESGLVPDWKPDRVFGPARGGTSHPARGATGWRVC